MSVSDFEIQNTTAPKEDKGLTLNQIVEATGMDKSALYRYLSQPDIRALLAPSENPVRYRRELMPIFHALAQAHKNETVKPKTAANLIRQQLDGKTLVSDSEMQNGLMLVPDSEMEKTRSEIRILDSETASGELMPRLVQAVERMASAAESRKRLDLLTVSEVAGMLQMSESWVSKHVPKVKLGRKVRYSRSALARFISDSETRK